MQRHGYKGAFEMAATVDYLFGYDATAHVVEDWMYERVTDAYVADPDVRKFFEQSNPWALHGDRRAAARGGRARACGTPSAEDLHLLRRTLLEAEGWQEGAEAPQSASVPGRQHRCRRLARAFGHGIAPQMDCWRARKAFGRAGAGGSGDP